MHTVVWLYFKIQWNLDKTKTQGTDKLCLLQWGFVIWRFFFTYCTIPGEKKIVRYTKDFVINYRGSSHWGFTVRWRKIQSMIKGQGWLWCSNAEHSCLVFVLKKMISFCLKLCWFLQWNPIEQPTSMKWPFARTLRVAAYFIYIPYILVMSKKSVSWFINWFRTHFSLQKRQKNYIIKVLTF